MDANELTIKKGFSISRGYNNQIINISFGDIAKSRLFISIDKHTQNDGIHVYFGPTYVGTTHGCVITIGRYCLIAHTRNAK